MLYIWSCASTIGSRSGSYGSEHSTIEPVVSDGLPGRSSVCRRKRRDAAAVSGGNGASVAAFGTRCARRRGGQSRRQTPLR